MSEHTPGPWMVWEPETEHGHGNEPAGRIVIGKEKPDVTQEIAYVNCESFYFDAEDRVPVPSGLIVESHWPTAPAEAMANARLIAQAPRLLEVLEDVLGGLKYYCGDNKFVSGSIANAESVIAACGQSQPEEWPMLTDPLILVKKVRGTFRAGQVGWTGARFEAYIAAKPEARGEGRSEASAIGDLVMSHPELFGVAIQYPETIDGE